ncbi:MAG: hybrid sensor histidine kinase/response regulator [Arenimonas sp.]|jgi:two-component system sensor histidine kinase and response regulator WspE
MSNDLSQFSMHDLFRLEVEGQREILTAGLLALERQPSAADQLEACMRAAHSLKGAARIVGLSAAVSVAHAMEDCFVAAQQGQVILRKRRIDLLFRGVDLLVLIAATPEAEAEKWTSAAPPEVADFQRDLAAALATDADAETEAMTVMEAAAPEPALAASEAAMAGVAATSISPAAAADAKDRTLRVSAQNLNRLLGLSGESLVESRWLTPFAESLLRLKRMQGIAGRRLNALQESLSGLALDDRAQTDLADVRHKFAECEHFLAQRLADLESFDQRSGSVARRLYDEAIACRMRPFSDRIQAFPRMVRDLSHELHKQAVLEVIGESTQVDRDVLEKLEAPLTHLLRNSIDHGIETAEERLAAGKPAEGVIRLEARHAAGMLQISVSDDGRGIDLDQVRRTVVVRGLTDQATADQLTEAELLEFLFLPGFTVKETVTEISGRGVGLDAVQNMVKQLRGSLRVSTEPGQGARFQMHLPLTISVVRALLTEIGGEPYAFPLAFIVNTLSVPRQDIQVLEGRQHFSSEGRQIGLVVALQVFGGSDAGLGRNELPVVVVGDQNNKYGVVVDRFLGVRELVVHPLDPRLGKIKDVSAGALLETGVPALIVDVYDLIRSIDKLIATGHLSKVGTASDELRRGPRRKRVLVVDDSLTVRELERKLIESGGFEVEVAVDGADGWNAVRVGHFDLVVTDVDMPRLDGIGLVTLIKQDPRLQSVPVMIVSYKDREEDRQRGLEAGADFYLTKGSFHDETLLQAVRDLVGEADDGTSA